MKIRIGKKPNQTEIHRVALIHRAGHTYVFGANVDQKEINALRVQVPFRIAFDRVSEKWTIGGHVSQGIAIGEAIVCWVSWYAGAIETLFFGFEEFAMEKDHINFQLADEHLALYDITTPDNINLGPHEPRAKLEDVLNEHWPVEFIPADEGVTGDVAQNIVIDLSSAVPHIPHPSLAHGAATLEIDYSALADQDRTDPEELEPEYDERKSVVLPQLLPDISDEMREAIMDMSMVGKTPTMREVMEGEQFSLSGIYHERTREHHIVGLFREAFPDKLVEVLTLRHLCKRYIEMIKLDYCDQINHAIDHHGPQTSVVHLKWMLNEIADNPNQSLTKKHRWFGYVQGLLIVYGFTSVPRERDYTRHFFNGQ